MTGNKKKRAWSCRSATLLLVALALLKIVDREQAKAVTGHGSVTRINARLLALVRAGYLRRILVG